jgi:ferredoxin
MTDPSEVRLWLGVDSGRCSGHARCNAISPEVFTLDDDGYSNIGENHPVRPAWEDAARRGVPACPEQALSLVVRDDR